MERNDSSSALAIVLVVLLLLVAAGGAFLFMGTRARSQALEAEARANESRDRAVEAVELARSESGATSTARTVAAESARGASVELDTAADAAPSEVFVHVVLDENPWIAGDWKGRVAWTPPGGTATRFRAESDRIALPVAPHSLEEFGEIEVDGLGAHAVALR
ncbi:MAG: hypothetical protein R3F34_12800, partial [Planctomycetota bacterium]